MKTEHLVNQYQELLSNWSLNKASLDYNILEQHKNVLCTISSIGNNGITVFDFNTKQHVFVSYNFSDIFGFDLQQVEREGNSYFDSRIHPEDFNVILRNGIQLLKFFLALAPDERINFKLINEYRILSNNNEYIRVVEQHQVLELDIDGNLWLSIGIIDISPNQNTMEGVKCQLLNFKTGQLFPLDFLDRVESNVVITKREAEILQLIKTGHLSKEISNILMISVHTVNTHRQRILEKLGANNAHEAIEFAKQKGII